MHIHSLRLSALVILGMGLVGCVPLRYQTKPIVTGVVVDAASQSPVSGAWVCFGGGSLQFRNDNVWRRYTKTRRDGTFNFSGQYCWRIYSPLTQTRWCAPIFLGGWLEVEHEGFEIYIAEIRTSGEKYEMVVPLKRVSK